MKEKLKRKNGITLIALIITIIVMLILVSVTISMAINGGLFEKAGEAVRKTQDAIDAEQKLADGRIKIGDKWYASIDDYLNNKPIQQGITIEETLKLEIEENYNVETSTKVTAKLTATLNEIEGTPVWTSSDEQVATVDQTGLVTAVAQGKAEITAKVEFEGKPYEARCKVTVEGPSTPATAESYVGYYADVNGDGKADGIIYADLAVGNTGSGKWNGNDGIYTIPQKEVSTLKTYKVSKSNYTGNLSIGKTEMLTATSEIGEDRFYVMALTNLDNSTHYWYYNANGKMSDYAKYTSVDFEKGKENTKKMMARWNKDNSVVTDANEVDYGEQKANDLWGLIETEVNNGWFVPSRAEWSAFASELGISKTSTDERYYGNLGLSSWYWSSSQYSTTYGACGAYFSIGYMSYSTVDSTLYVRMSATF